MRLYLGPRSVGEGAGLVMKRSGGGRSQEQDGGDQTTALPPGITMKLVSPSSVAVW